MTGVDQAGLGWTDVDRLECLKMRPYHQADCEWHSNQEIPRDGVPFTALLTISDLKEEPVAVRVGTAHVARCGVTHRFKRLRKKVRPSSVPFAIGAVSGSVITPAVTGGWASRC